MSRTCDPLRRLVSCFPPHPWLDALHPLVIAGLANRTLFNAGVCDASSFRLLQRGAASSGLSHRQWACFEHSVCCPQHGRGASIGGATAAAVALASVAAASYWNKPCSSKFGFVQLSPLRCDDDSIHRVAVARADDFKDGELRQVKIPADPSSGTTDGAILLARIDGVFYATGASCSHYSAPLAEGVAAKDRMHVVCPWHDAAFDVRTGQPVRGPALQAIPTFPVTIQDGKVVVDLPKNMDDFVNPRAVRRKPEDQRIFVVIGGGAAGVVAADALRQEGYTGRVIFLSEEKHLPYDRPVLSKNLAKASDPESLSLRDMRYFEEHDIEFRRCATVTMLDAERRVVRLATGEEIIYDRALVATGTKPRMLTIPGASVEGVLTLRTPEDAQKIAVLCTSGKCVVVIGSSFIGMELAATLRRRGCEVTVLGRESVPFERVLGKRLGESMRAFFESRGVKFVGEAVLTEIRRTGNSTFEAVLKGGRAIPCDAFVVGVGVIPNSGFVKGADKGPDGSLLTDEYLQTSAEGLFAAGDIATYAAPSTGEQRRVEHWDVAMSQGRVAARNMVGERKEAFDATPFFWTSLFGKNLRYVGYCPEFDEIIVDGNIQTLNFVIYYCFQGAVRAVATMARDPIAVAAGELMRMGKMPTAEALKSGGKDPTESLLDEVRRLSTQSA